MSMLTPSGMGGKYRVTGNAYPKMRPPRRRGRFVAAMIASVAVLGLFGWGGLQLFHVFKGNGSGDTKANAAPQNPTCSPAPAPTPTGKPAPLPQPAGVTMNIYNATPRGGLAKTTADELAKRGFKVIKFGNAPVGYDKKVSQSALIVAGPAAAREAGTQVAGSIVKIDPKRADKTVDVMIGTAFSALSSPADAAKARVVATNPPPPKATCASAPAAQANGKSSAKPSAKKPTGKP